MSQRVFSLLRATSSMRASSCTEAARMLALTCSRLSLAAALRISSLACMCRGKWVSPVLSRPTQFGRAYLGQVLLDLHERVQAAVQHPKLPHQPGPPELRVRHLHKSQEASPEQACSRSPSERIALIQQKRRAVTPGLSAVGPQEAPAELRAHRPALLKQDRLFDQGPHHALLLPLQHRMHPVESDGSDGLGIGGILLCRSRLAPWYDI